VLDAWPRGCAAPRTGTAFKAAVHFRFARESTRPKGMNKLHLETRVQIRTMLCEGSSMRSIGRVAGVDTVSKLLG
jgi:transposase-like protein